MKAAVLAVMLGAAIAVQVVRDRVYARAGIESDVLYITSADAMKRAALSYDSLLADVYWIRALQHYGGERLKPERERRFAMLYPLLDLTTTLDPLFTMGYRFGAIFLSEPHPGGAGRPQDAIRLLKKGIAFTPAKWDYYHDIGFIYYWNLHDYRQAAEWFGRGSEVEGAPWWLKTYSAVMLTRGGDRQASRAMWAQIGQSEDDWLRRTSQTRLAQLDALDQIDLLRRALAGFELRAGRRPRDWQELVDAGYLRSMPVDPAGVAYQLNPDTGEIGVRPDSPLWPLPTEPAAAPELKGEFPPVSQ